MSSQSQPFHAAPFIREIGRGKKGARDLSRDDARALYAAMLEDRVSDLELGALLIGMRIKGESVNEIGGFLDAAEASFALLQVPASEFAPVVIPSYNGSRHAAMVSAEFARQRPVFMPIAALAPRLHRLLALRRVLGLRNSTHTLVKIMQPFAQPVLRLVSYTHPEYLTMLTEYFSTVAPGSRGDVFLMRGTEGETVANAKRAQAVTWFHGNQATVLIEKQAPVDESPPLPPSSDAKTTAEWILQALEGKQPVPAPIAEQVRQCVQVASQMRERA